MRIHRALFPIGLFFIATGFTDCEYFHEVTVPRFGDDTTRPSVFGGVWEGDRATGTYVQLAFGNDTFTYRGVYGEPITMVAGGTDDGGVHRVELSVSWLLYCLDDESTWPGLRGDIEVARYQPPASAGDRVSNGVYAKHTTATCPHGGRGVYSGTFKAKVVDYNERMTQTPAYNVVLKSPGVN